ncbi:MAG: NBR1-Ig-like domain-containing protein, partial [Anaerolineales bacterium]|nr:NBR1-Ig-like domain-containing protein [Anaerolineales bacterium]
MKIPVKYFIPILLATALSMSACYLLAPRVTTPLSPEAIYTQAAQTLDAQSTLSALVTAVMQLTQAAYTPTPSATLLASATYAPPTATITTIAPPSPTPQPPTNTPVTRPCHQVEFIKDVTIADGTIFTPGAEFTKIWRVRNSGTCSWTPKYYLLFVNGDHMGVSKAYPLNGRVQPGETVDLAVDLIAPAYQGTYRSYWMLSDPNNQFFGMGSNAEKPFWTEITVRPSNQNFAYDFGVNLCVASWSSSAGSLPCPGNSKSDKGSV